MRRIAVEEHFIPKTFADYLRSKQHILGGQDESGPLSIEKRLKAMDEAGIDMQVLSIGLSGLYDLPASTGTAMSREINDEIAEVANKYPRRFAGFAAIAPQDPEAAADELERAVKKLGLKGTMITSHINGEYLDEKKFWIILERAAKLDVPIYIHCSSPSPDMIKPYLKYPQLLSAFWGFGAETGLLAMRLICSGFFDEYPDLKIISGHMGESLPFWLWRLDNSWQREKIKEEVIQLQKNPSEYIKQNFYLTTSGMFWPAVIQFVCLTLGADRILFAVDYPVGSNKEAVESIENTPICYGDKEKIFHLNAEKVLKL